MEEKIIKNEKLKGYKSNEDFVKSMAEMESALNKSTFEVVEKDFIKASLSLMIQIVIRNE